MLEEIYRIDSVQGFLKNFPTYNWKNMVFLLLEYGVMLFEHNFNINQVCYNDVCKIVEDLKYEKYNFIKTTDKKLHSILSKNLIIERNENQNFIDENNSNNVNNFNNRNESNYYNNQNIQNNNQNNSERVNFRFSGQNSSRQSRIDINSKSNFNQNFNSNSEFNTNNFNNGMTSKINSLKNIPESYDTNYFSNKALSPTKSYNSNNSIRSQILERALDQSPTVKPGKFVFLEEDPFTKEVLIKVNKETYENHIKNNNNNLVFEKSKKHYEKFIKPISDQTERLKGYKPKNKEERKKDYKDKYSVDEILQKLKLDKKKEYDTYSNSTTTDLNNFIVKDTENTVTNTNTDSVSNNRGMLKNNLAEINKKMQNDDSTFLNEKLLKYDKNKKNKYVTARDDDTISNDKTVYLVKGNNKGKGKSKKIVINTFNNLKEDYSILSDYDESDSINTTEEIILKSNKKDNFGGKKNYSIKNELNYNNDTDILKKNTRKSKNLFKLLDYDLYQTNSINETESVLSTFYHK